VHVGHTSGVSIPRRPRKRDGFHLRLKPSNMSSQDFKELRVTLATKPGATLYAALRHPNPSSSDSNPLADTLVVFLNGLLLPSATWSETISHLLSLRKTLNQPTPAILCYDRYGQGKSDPDPTDDLASDPDYGHGPLSSIVDLHQLLQQLSYDELHIPLGSLRLILVCNSIGCALARLYAATYHTDSQIVAYVFLDSMMANTDFVSIFPDPDKPEFDKRKLPKGVTPNDLRHARLKFRQYFHPDVPNAERLDRRALRDLLPLADGPALPQGLGGSPALLTVVGHDWEEFAEQCERVRSDSSKPSLRLACL
jgi:pimeloyl-ACP methyl ester carboxylesterase